MVTIIYLIIIGYLIYSDHSFRLFDQINEGENIDYLLLIYRSINQIKVFDLNELEYSYNVTINC